MAIQRYKPAMTEILINILADLLKRLLHNETDQIAPGRTPSTLFTMSFLMATYPCPTVGAIEMGGGLSHAAIIELEQLIREVPKEIWAAKEAPLVIFDQIPVLGPFS